MSAPLRTVVVIPARMGSSRFPGKPLVSILGLPMIEHVRRRAELCAGVDVIVATCDEEIRAEVERAGGRVVMTADTHERCTDRIEEAAQALDYDIVVNVQGDEPTLLPEVITQVTAPFRAREDVLTTCIVYPLTDLSELDNPNVVKTVLSRSGSILYFSRSGIPSRVRRGQGPYFKQSGIMAFRKSFLHQYSRLAPTPLEAIESVDMMRVLEHDIRIQAVVVPAPTLGVDVPDDVAKVEQVLRDDTRQAGLLAQILR